MCDHLFDLCQLTPSQAGRLDEPKIAAPTSCDVSRPLNPATALLQIVLAVAILSCVAAARVATAQSQPAEVVFRQTIGTSCTSPESTAARAAAAAASRNPFRKSRTASGAHTRDESRQQTAAPVGVRAKPKPRPATPAKPRPKSNQQSAARATAPAKKNQKPREGVRQTRFQPQPTAAPPVELLPSLIAKNPCAPAGEKRLDELDIGIGLPSGGLPSDSAADCWNQLNASAGPLAAARCWPTAAYRWTAACTCYRPLYFEQINLERHGYGCCEALQPLESAAHFFGTVPALPYLMAADCPCQCDYTLGHYRPGSGPPWRHHWPSCSLLAAAAEGGVLTGLIFLIP